MQTFGGRRFGRRNSRGAGASAPVALRPPTAGMVDWYPPESIDLVTPQWSDLGPSGYHLAKVFANNPSPGIPIDGRATLDVSAGGRALKESLSSLAQPWTTYVVVRTDVFTGTALLYDGHSGVNRSTLFHAASADLTANAGANLTATGAWRAHSVHAVRITADGASSAIYVTDLTGTPVASGNMGTGTWGGKTLGSGNTGSNSWGGDIAETIRYSGAHDASAVASYLLRKYPSIAKRAWATTDLLCVGDSITVGLGSTDGRGYRSLIRRAFEAADVEEGVRTLRFVGPTNDRCMDHFAVSGEIIADIRDGIAAQITAHSPDVLVMLMGTNDCRNNGAVYDSTATPQAYADTLANIAATNPALPVVVCLVPPMTDGTANANVNDLNAELLATVIPGAASPTTTCDLNSILTAGAHLSDGVHPNDDGYALIADAIEAAIRSATA